MREIQTGGIQVDITNYCDKICSNCTRFIGNYKKEQMFHMNIETFEKIVISMKDFPDILGIIGGEPTLHPQFLEFCEILRKHRDKCLCGLWSNQGSMYEKYENDIKNTFGSLYLNQHIEPIFHTPLLVSSKSVINDDKLRKNFIENCWIQNCWSASVNHKGAFFCEVAGAMSILYDGPMGISIETKDWWKTPLEEFQYQIDWACQQCGGAIPLKPRRSNSLIDDMSEDNFNKLKDQSFKIKNNYFKIFNDNIDINQIRNVNWYREYKPKSKPLPVKLIKI